MYQNSSSHTGLIAFIVGSVVGLALILLGVAAFLVLDRTRSGATDTAMTETPSAIVAIPTATETLADRATPTAQTILITATPQPGAQPTSVPIPTVTPLGAAPTQPVTQNVRLRSGNGPDFLAPYMPAGQFVPDGQLTEWRGAGVPLTFAHIGPEQWSGPADLSGTGWLGWDEQNLYLAARVVDDVHVQTQTSWEMYHGDSVELWIDADLQGDFDKPQGDADDWQFGFSPGDFQTLRPEGVVYIPVRDLNLNRQLVVNALPDGSGYTLEASIPWAMLQVQPQHGMALGYTIDLSDNDAPGTAQQQTEVTHNPNFQFNTPTTFGNLILQ